MYMMDAQHKDRLARVGDSGKKANAARLKAAIASLGMSQSEFARRSGQQPTALSNSLSGMVFPSRRTLQELYRSHQIDPTFIQFGDYGQMPVAVQDRIFAALEDVERSADP